MSLTQKVPVNKNFEKMIAIILRTGLVKAMVKLFNEFVLDMT